MIGKRNVYDAINEYDDEQLEELKARWPNRDEIYDVGEHVEIVRGTWQYDQGRIVMRRQDKGDYSYGVVFDWDVRMHVTYFTGKDFKRVQR